MSRAISIEEARRLGLLKGPKVGGTKRVPSRDKRRPKRKSGVNGTREHGMLVGPPSKGAVREAKRVEVIR